MTMVWPYISRNHSSDHDSSSAHGWGGAGMAGGAGGEAGGADGGGVGGEGGAAGGSAGGGSCGGGGGGGGALSVGASTSISTPGSRALSAAARVSDFMELVMADGSDCSPTTITAVLAERLVVAEEVTLAPWLESASPTREAAFSLEAMLAL